MRKREVEGVLKGGVRGGSGIRGVEEKGRGGRGKGKGELEKEVGREKKKKKGRRKG